jgi:hypothetical protein
MEGLSFVTPVIGLKDLILERKIMMMMIED